FILRVVWCGVCGFCYISPIRIHPMTKTARVFWNGRSQAVRLPKEFRMPGHEVRIRKQGSGVLIEPIETGWEWLDEIAGKFSPDFFAQGRAQPYLSEREGLHQAFEK
ncbi:MAG: type II toxin-antitoxin system VapB family antitoxin, partial [Gammaproteobacteria bacterium]|nr:type II toxin-antitoxin system VapB family antitoxin [Gammaproteobacteria bacterium]